MSPRPDPHLPSARGAGWSVFLVALTLPLLLIALPVILPIVAFQLERDRRHRHVAARYAMCIRCGALLGEEALARADAAWSAYVAELHRAHPTSRFRLVRTVHAICGACGAPYQWLETERRFAPDGRPG